MSTAVITRNSYYLDTPRLHESTENPLAYHNLEIIKRLGKGKFPIYITSSKITNQLYVMKIFSDSPEYYQNEARFAALSHSNVVNIVQHEKQPGLRYILSEYAPHGDLFDFLISHKEEIDEKLIRTYFRQLVDGLEYLHYIGVAHLDLKPENLLIGADFNLKIADFDLSYIVGDHHALGRGTKYYRAPELYNSSSSDIELGLPFAADIYSAGIILFILKSGGIYPHVENRTVEGVNLTDLMHKNSRKFWSKHRKLQNKEKSFFDSSFRELFHKMVKADPKQRITIKKIKQSKWYNGPIYSPEELTLRMKILLHLYH